MAIIGCLACNGKVSTEAVACPHCGHPINGEASVKQSLQVSVSQEAPGFLSGLGYELGKRVGCLLFFVILILALLHLCS